MITRKFAASPVLRILSVIIAGAILYGCNSSSSTGGADSSSLPDSQSTHADNDIVMTLRSMIDALSLDEPLDSAEYSFQGILTDGSGMPLYTDIQGTPGQWKIDVISPTKVRIRNLYLGDLVPEELSQYILHGLAITDNHKFHGGSPEEFPDSEIEIYDLGENQLIFAISNAKTESGHSGPQMNIVLRKKEQIPE